jgi:hypothetical protein
MSNQWQPKTRGGNPVENVRPIDFDFGIWKWQGEVTYSDGEKFILTWTEDGYHMSHKQPMGSDLVPLESPVEASAETAKVQAHNKPVLALAATRYKRACDATEAAEEAERLAHDALAVAFESYGVPTVVVNIDGAAILFERNHVGVGYAEIEVL